MDASAAAMLPPVSEGKVDENRGLKRRLSCASTDRPVATPVRQPSNEEEGDFECKDCETQATVSSQKSSKRTDYLSWDDYFMAVAALSAMRSKDPSTQVGACIVNPQNRIVGIGYNGFPAGCSDDDLPWERQAASPLDTKYLYVCHAEMNAILNRIAADTRGCRIYVDLFPCNECAKLIIQSGIREVIYVSDKYHTVPAFVASRRLFQCAGVSVRQHTSPKKIEIDLSVADI